MIDLQQKVNISSEVLFQEVDGETVLLDLQGESYFGLDEVGTRIWQLMQEASDLQMIFDVILKEYDVEEKLLRLDFQNLITQLVEAGLITLAIVEQRDE